VTLFRWVIGFGRFERRPYLHLQG